MKERVQKLMAQAGVASRRESENLIQQGRVKVNGKVIHLGDQADPETDIIEVDGDKLTFPERHTYIAFYKPRNVLSTDDPHKGDTRRTVYDFVPFQGRLFSIGRLDAESEGLMVLTDDGDLANRLAHPRYRHTKTYKVTVYGLPTMETLQKWETGVYLTDDETDETYRTAPCKVDIVQGGKETTLRIIMTEGKKRQIRRVASALGHPVKTLMRTHIGKLGLSPLRSGEWRELTTDDVKAMKTPAPELREVTSKPRRSGMSSPATSPHQTQPEDSDRPRSRKPSLKRRSDEDDRSERRPSRGPKSGRRDDNRSGNRPSRQPQQRRSPRSTRKGRG